MQSRALYSQRERCAAWKRSHYLPVLLKKCRAEYFLLMGMIIKTGRWRKTGKILDKYFFGCWNRHKTCGSEPARDGAISFNIDGD
jgi:hypothetical protein